MRSARRIGARQGGTVLLAAIAACCGLAAGAWAQERAKVSRAGWEAVVVPAPQKVHSRKGPIGRTASQLVPLSTAPFPYDGVVPKTRLPFLETAADGRRFHRTASGRVLWEQASFSDSRVLLHIPKGFDARRPGLIVVFFHGHGATLTRDVFNRQRVASQLTRSGLNAVLVAPQFAVNAADSSAGKLWYEGGLARLLDEAAVELGKMYGDPAAEQTFARMPLVLVAYSGGYAPAAWSLQHGGLGKRVRGVVLLDAAYGELDTFAEWAGGDRRRFLVSAYTSSTRNGNALLHARLTELGVANVAATLDGPVVPGTVAFLPGSPTSNHRDFLTRAWTDFPLTDVLGRVRGYPRS